MKAGDMVLLEWEEYGQRRQTEARIMLASKNGESLMVEFEAILRGHAGMCPLMRREGGGYYSIMDGLPVSVTPLGSAGRVAQQQGGA